MVISHSYVSLPEGIHRLSLVDSCAYLAADMFQNAAADIKKGCKDATVKSHRISS